MSLTSLLKTRSYLFCGKPIYLGIKLDRALAFRRHLESLCKKLTTRFGLFKRLAGSSWGASATTSRTATLALVHSTAEYYAPVWCHSAHTRLIDKSINDAMRIVTGCLCPTPTNNLVILAGIQPIELRRQKITLPLACRAQEPEQLVQKKDCVLIFWASSATQIEAPICAENTSRLHLLISFVSFVTSECPFPDLLYKGQA